VRKLVVAVLALGLAACQKPEDQPKTADTTVSDTAVSKPDTLHESVTDQSANQMVALHATFDSLMVEDSLFQALSARESAVGLTKEGHNASFCEMYERITRWQSLKTSLTPLVTSQNGAKALLDTAHRHFVEDVRLIAPRLAKQEFTKGGASETEGSPYSDVVCATETHLESLDAILGVMDWIVEAELKPSDIGFNSQAVRAIAARIMAQEVRNVGFKGILRCGCESPLPEQFRRFGFTREELHFTEKEWHQAVEKDQPNG
jgi:hypothetical protein